MVSLAAWPSEQITPVGRGEQMAGGTALPDISDQKMLRSVSSAARPDAMLWYTIAALGAECPSRARASGQVTVVVQLDVRPAQR
jgi:hypothetical protein